MDKVIYVGVPASHSLVTDKEVTTEKQYYKDKLHDKINSIDRIDLLIFLNRLIYNILTREGIEVSE